MNPLLGGALGSNIAEKKGVRALVRRSHTLSAPDYPSSWRGVRDSANTTYHLQIWRRVIFAVLSQSAKTAKIMRLENLALYGNRFILLHGYVVT